MGTGLVVGIHGPWGDGKTTVLNMLRQNLAVDDKIVVRDFNPWRLSDEDSMLRGFFSMLAEAIGESLSTKLERTTAGAGKLAKLVRHLTRFARFFCKTAESIDDILAKLGEVAKSGDTVGLDDLRKRIDVLLKNAEKQIVVLVDDIDRLDKDETHTLFRLIKACADFPNVSYVLAFDDVAVASSLGDRYGSGDEVSGRAFLEKIIQVPLKLPAAMKEDLRSLCFQQVDRALLAAGIELSREEVGKFVSGFDRGISIRLATPRAAKRYGNGLMFALPMLKGEVNTVDLLLLEALRVFYPTIYDTIRNHHEQFDGNTELWGKGHEKESRSATLLKALFEKLESEERKAAQKLIATLFPRMNAAFGGPSYGSDFAELWTKQKRVCSPEYCPRYFSYSVLKSDVSDSEINALFTKAAGESAAKVGKHLVAYFEAGKAKRVIERMRQREESTPPEAVAPLCVAIAANAKHIPNPPSFLSFAEPVSQAGILISQLIMRLPAGQQRVELAKQIIRDADPLWFGGEVLRWLYITDDADKADSNTLTKAQVMDVRKVLVQRIKKRAEAGEPLFNIDIPQEQSLLYEWWRVEGREPVQAHLASVLAKDHNKIALFLQSMAPRAWGEGDVMPRVGLLGGDQLKSIKLIYDLDALAQLIRQHLSGDFEDPQWLPDASKPVEQRLAEQFMFVLDKWKKDGEPPDAHSGDSGGSS